VLIGGLAVGVPARLLFTGPKSGLIFGLLIGLLGGLRVGLDPIGAVATDPRDPIRNDAILWLGIGFGFGVAFGLALIRLSGWRMRSSLGLVSGLGSASSWGWLAGAQGMRGYDTSSL
jgi:hypothetical protein